MSRLVLFNILIVICAYCESARILGVVPTPSYSHQIAYRPLWKALLKRGHQLTILTTDPMNDKSLENLTEINLHFAYKPWNQNLTSLISEHKNPFTFLAVFFQIISKIIELELQDTKVQALIKDTNHHFDVVMVEFMFPTMFAFAERFQCPLIAMTSLDAPSGIYRLMGNPPHPILNPDVSLPFSGQLNFFERVISVLYGIVTDFYIRTVIPNEDLIIKKYFEKDYPPLEEISKHISMLFVNADPIFYPVRPTVPTIVQIKDGSHLLESSLPLPKDLQEYLDEGKEGFIYFSLGSNVKSKDLPESTRNVILQTFAELKYRVLWKFELDNLPGKPENVKISKWFPQRDIFKHPNIRLFITQGGIQSMEEAIHNHVPMIGLPFFGDQIPNIKIMVSKKLGLSLDHQTLDKESFKKAIFEVINNPSYRHNIMRVADLIHDQPMSGTERAVWWMEYVIRHKGARHLRSPVLDLPVYQYYLLDVIGFCIFVIVITIMLITLAVRSIIKAVRYFIPKQKVKTQ